MRFPALTGAREAVAAHDAAPEVLPTEICARGGLLLIPGMHEISEEPELLLRLSKLLGPEVEDYRNSHAFEDRKSLFNDHDTVPEIIEVTNMPPMPPDRQLSEVLCTTVPTRPFRQAMHSRPATSCRTRGLSARMPDRISP